MYAILHNPFGFESIAHENYYIDCHCWKLIEYTNDFDCLLYCHVVRFVIFSSVLRTLALSHSLFSCSVPFYAFQKQQIVFVRRYRDANCYFISSQWWFLNALKIAREKSKIVSSYFQKKNSNTSECVRIHYSHLFLYFDRIWNAFWETCLSKLWMTKQFGD